jgi:hypothetical protein
MGFYQINEELVHELAPPHAHNHGAISSIRAQQFLTHLPDRHEDIWSALLLLNQRKNQKSAARDTHGRAGEWRQILSGSS